MSRKYCPACRGENWTLCLLCPDCQKAVEGMYIGHARAEKLNAELADLHAVAADAIAERDSLRVLESRSLGERLKAQTCGFEDGRGRRL